MTQTCLKWASLDWWPIWCSCQTMSCCSPKLKCRTCWWLVWGEHLWWSIIPTHVLLSCSSPKWKLTKEFRKISIYMSSCHSRTVKQPVTMEAGRVKWKTRWRRWIYAFFSLSFSLSFVLFSLLFSLLVLLLIPHIFRTPRRSGRLAMTFSMRRTSREPWRSTRRQLHVERGVPKCLLRVWQKPTGD